MNVADSNADPREVAKFEALASRWWDTHGAFKALHDINPLRLAFVEATSSLAGRTVLDVGCGGGILAESMAEPGQRSNRRCGCWSPAAWRSPYRPWF